MKYGKTITPMGLLQTKGRAIKLCPTSLNTARNYDHQIGRFCSTDPASQMASEYTGMANNPANMIDPSGCWSGNASGSYYSDGRSNNNGFNWANVVDGDPQDRPGVKVMLDGTRLNDLAGLDFLNNINKDISGMNSENSTILNANDVSVPYTETISSYTNNVAVYSNVNPMVTVGYYKQLNVLDEINYDYSNINNAGSNFSLGAMYGHFQVGGGQTMLINMATINLSGTTQRALGLTGMEVNKTRPVNLFNAGATNTAALAFGSVYMKYYGNDQFSIVGDGASRFDFSPLINQSASWGRNAGNILGLGINYGLLNPLIPLIWGGPYDVNFNGTTYIPK